MAITRNWYENITKIIATQQEKTEHLNKIQIEMMMKGL